MRENVIPSLRRSLPLSEANGSGQAPARIQSIDTDRLIFILIAIALFSPVISLPGSSFLYPYYGAPVFFFQIATVAALILAIFKARTPLFLGERGIGILSAGIISYWLLEIVINLFSLDLNRSLLGSAERMNSLWNGIHYLFFFLVVVYLLKSNPKYRSLFLQCWIGAAALGSLKFFYLLIFNDRALRVLPLGNESFFATFIVLTLPAAVWVLLGAEKRLKYLYGGIFCLLVIALFILSNRASFLALVLGAIVFSFSFVIRRRRAFMFFSASMLLIFIIGGLILNFRETPFVQGNYLLQKFSSINLQEAGISKRFILYKIGWNALKERPLTGWGRENSEAAFEKHYDPAFISNFGQEVWSDRFHNIFVDTLVERGFLGLLALLAMAVVLAYSIFKIGRAIKNFRLIWLLFCGMYGFVMLFTFDTHGSLLPLYAGVAYIASHEEEGVLNSQILRNIQIRKFFSYLCIAILVVASYFLTIRPLSAGFSLQAARNFIPRDFNQFKKHFANAMELTSEKSAYRSEMLFEAGRLLAFQERRTRGDLRFVPFSERMVKEIEETVPWTPTNIRLQHILGEFYKNRAFRNPDFMPQAIGYWQALLSKYPKRQYVILHLAEIYSKAGNLEKSLQLVDQLIAINPTFSEPYWIKGKILFNGSKTDEFVDFFKKAIDLRPARFIEVTTEDIKVAEILSRFPGTERHVLKIYKSAIFFSPNNQEFHRRLSEIYEKIGDNENAAKHKEISAMLRAQSKPQ